MSQLIIWSLSFLFGVYPQPVPEFSGGQGARIREYEGCINKKGAPEDAIFLTVGHKRHGIEGQINIILNVPRKVTQFVLKEVVGAIDEAIINMQPPLLREFFSELFWRFVRNDIVLVALQNHAGYGTRRQE